MNEEIDDLEIEITLQPVPLAAARLLVVGAVCRRAFLELDPATAAASDDPEGDRFDLAAWLTEEGLDHYISSSERQLLNRRIGALPVEEAQEASWQIEAATALAWALEFLGEPPPLDEPFDPATLLALLPSPWDKTGPFRENAELLPEDLIAIERERAELWYWRAEVETDRAAAKGRRLTELNAAVGEVAAEAAAAGFFASPIDNDFPVGGRSYRTTPPAHLEALAAVATERLRALNWLCGLARTWDAPVSI
jgi:hypothetical protein